MLWLTIAFVAAMGFFDLLQWQVALVGALAGIAVVISYYFSIAGVLHAQFAGLVVCSLMGSAAIHGTHGVNDKVQILVFFAACINIVSIAAIWTKTANCKG